MVKPENKIGCDSPGGQQAQCHYNDSKGAFLCCVAQPCVLLPQARALAPRTCSVSGQPIFLSLDGLDCSLLSILVALSVRRRNLRLLHQAVRRLRYLEPNGNNHTKTPFFVSWLSHSAFIFHASILPMELVGASNVSALPPFRILGASGNVLGKRRGSCPGMHS